MNLNWKEFFIGAVATVVGIPLLVLGIGMATVEYYNWSSCSALEDAGTDSAKRQYLFSLANKWSTNDELFQRVKASGGFLSLQAPYLDQQQSIDWEYLDIDFGVGAEFIGEQLLVAVRFIDDTRATGRSHITIVLDESSLDLKSSKLITQGSVEVADNTYVYCEDWR